SRGVTAGYEALSSGPRNTQTPACGTATIAYSSRPSCAPGATKSIIMRPPVRSSSTARSLGRHRRSCTVITRGLPSQPTPDHTDGAVQQGVERPRDPDTEHQDHREAGHHRRGHQRLLSATEATRNASLAPARHHHAVEGLIQADERDVCEHY